MARKVRVEFAGACYHVLNRGNYRQDLFAPSGAAESFQKCLFEAAGSFGWRLHAFIVMRNHFHVALETPEPNLSDGMQWLQATWTARFNRFHGEGGRAFQGRYKALHVEPGRALAEVAHYIHLNPVRAKIVPAKRLLEFRWSSLPLFLQGRKRPAELEAAVVLGESGELPDTATGWKRYLGYLEVVAEEEGRLRDKKFGRLSRGWVIGSREFRQELQKELKEADAARERFELLGADREGHQEMRAAVWEEKLQAMAEASGANLENLPARKSAAAKVQLAALMKAATSVSNGWLAERLAMGKPASVSQYVRRFRLAGETEKRAFKTLLSRIKT
jgi:putative transposase